MFFHGDAAGREIEQAEPTGGMVVRLETSARKIT